MKRFLRRGSSTIRARIMLALVLVAGTALAVSGVIVAVLQERHIQDLATERLEKARNELEALATDGVNPETKEPFDSVSDVLYTYLVRRSVVGPGTGEVGYVEGRLTWTSPDKVKLRPEQDPELLDAIQPDLAGQGSVIRPVRTSQGSYKVLVAVVMLGDQRGALVRVIDLGQTGGELRRTMVFYAGAAVLTVMMLIAPAWLAVGMLLRPIGELRLATDQIHEHDLTTRVPVRGRDDLTALAKAVNRMLDRVQGAVEGQRRLLDDVGHELRTPITVVRGHLELIDATDPDDVRQTRELALDELDRMGTLVAGLLEVARSSSSDFVSPAPTDVAALTAQVFDKARALGPRDWVLGPSAETTAVIDATRITEAWLELATNAVKYSPPGSPIRLGSLVAGDELLLRVEDRGIGIAPQDLPTIRRRLARAPQAAALAPGTGLGLSVVENIVAAHGGALDVESAPGRGSIFTLRLPLTPARSAANESEGVS